MTHAQALRLSLYALGFIPRGDDWRGKPLDEARAVLTEMLHAEEEYERDNACGEELNPERKDDGE
jgi:hypothetical protein